MELLPNKNDDYGSQNYWVDRFEKERTYEWLVNYSHIKDLIAKHVNKSASILILGCGNSLLGNEMFEDGYEQIHSMDYCENVITRMVDLTVNSANLFWLICDARNMPFKDSFFDVVIDKATLDTFLVGERSLWNLSDSTNKTFRKVLKEVSRVLTDDGLFLSISFNEPIFRAPLLTKQDISWGIKSIEKIGKDFHHFFYVVQNNLPLEQQFKVYDYEPPQILSSNYEAHEPAENDVFSIDL